MALRTFHLIERRAFDRHKLVVDGQKMFARDVQRRGWQKVMNIGDAAGNRVFDRDHTQIGRTILDQLERILKGCAGHRLGVGIGFFAGNVRVGARLALENNLHISVWRKALCAFRTTALLRCSLHVA
jgi:hypothetical protein